MQKELKSIEMNNTWTLTELPPGHKQSQRQGIDFGKVFATVAKLDTVRIILALAAIRSWEVHHMDIKLAFLNRELEKEVYVTQPGGFEVQGQEHLVYRLSKSLYGLRQAPRAWNTRIDRSLKELGFIRYSQVQAIYTRGEGDVAVIMGVYVDDLIMTGDNTREVKSFKQQMMTEFEMSDLGLLSCYLGIEVE
ncbi:Retrovirus-related Pol polyprotein from transposon TNT 1-94-like protein [Drosera capensis]